MLGRVEDTSPPEGVDRLTWRHHLRSLVKAERVLQLLSTNVKPGYARAGDRLKGRA